MLAVILTGIVLGSVGTSYVILFAASAVICTCLVELRGLFLTVVLFPFYWFFGVTAAGMIANASDTGGGRTLLLTSAYPAVENFLWLAVTFAVCLAIGVLRWRVDVAALENQRRRERARRRHLNESEATNQQLNSRLRNSAGPDRPVRSHRRDNSGRADRPGRLEDEQPRRRTDFRSYPGYPGYPGSTDGANGESDNSTDGTPSSDSRTRTAAELREASRRRRSRSQDRPLDMD